MFKRFSGSQEQYKLTSSLLQQIQAEFKEMMNHLNSIMINDFSKNPFDLEQLEAKKVFRKVDLELQTAQYHLKTVIAIWPTGKPVFIELTKFFNYFKQFVDNLMQWTDLVHNPDFDIFKSADKSKYQHYVARNRELGQIVDAQFIKANSKLKELTRQELPPFGE